MPLTVGMIGYGEIAQYHRRHLTAAGARVAGVVTTRQVPPELQKYPSLAAMLPDVDAVSIAVPNFLHASLCLEAVAAGKPVFVEKPLCLRQEELEELDRRLPMAKAPVHVGFRLRWNPRLRVLRERIQELRRIRCGYRLGIERLAAGKGWTRREAESGGAYFTLGVHALDLSRWLAGAAGEPLRLTRATEECRDSSADFPLIASLSGTLPNGVEIFVRADLRGDCPFALELAVEGMEDYTLDRLPGQEPEEPGAGEVEYAAMMAEFVRTAESGRCQPEDVVEVLECHRELIEAHRIALRE